MTNAEMEAKVKDLMSRHATVLQKKAALSGQLQAKRDELATVVREIREAGYDPKNLVEETRKAKAALEAEIVSFEEDLAKVEKALAAFDR